MNVFTSWLGMSDEQAMWRVQMHDDNQAFAQLMSRWEGPIQRLCIRMLGDQHKAEDLTQEAFAKIYAKRKEFQHGSRFSTFLWRVATNLCLDELRRVKRRRELSIIPRAGESNEGDAWAEFAADAPTPDHSTASEEQADLVRRAVAELPEHYRVVVVLRHYEDLKFREIADVLDVPEGTVKSRMSEALSILNASLTKALNERAGTKAAKWTTAQSINHKEALVL